MFISSFFVAFVFVQWASNVFALPGQRTAPALKKSRGCDIPIGRSNGLSRRGNVNGQTGLGNNADLLYSVPVELGSTVAAFNLDTGSSDLWVLSDACLTAVCNKSSVERYPSAQISSKADVAMYYGDSKTGTHAFGQAVLDTVTIAGVAMTNQAFAAINDTDNPVVEYAIAGIFGLGFPTGSVIQNSIVEAQTSSITGTDNFLTATYSYGPLLSRIVITGALEMPMFSIMLERDTIDISGTGLLTVGKLPDGVDNSSLTWVPVRLYTAKEGGIAAPSYSPNEIYPYRWEVPLDGVFLDGNRVPDSTIPNQTNSTQISALIDTGNSILRGPQDMVNSILSTVSPSYNPSLSNPTAPLPCNVPHNLTFQIGGKMFPIDPRDFIGQRTKGDATTCVADNLVSTDPPSIGALYSWSLGATFFKSNLVAFHYGNLTHPSVDPPRIGFLSTVPANADDLLKQAVINAQNNGGNFEQSLVVAPTASAATESQITVAEETFSIPTSKPTNTVVATLSLQATSISAPSQTSNSQLYTIPKTWTIWILFFLPALLPLI